MIDEKQLKDLPDDVLDPLLTFLEQTLELRRYRAMDFFKPYPKQSQFFEYGADYPERCLTAGNQYGKTICGAFEAACHLTGIYPDWWNGRRFTKPVKAWACGETGAKVRDNLQAKLVGEQAYSKDHPNWGTGYIPREALHDRTLSHGSTGAFDTLVVQHRGPHGEHDGLSTLGFKSYDQGREKFASDTLDFIWFDEEPPLDVYTEGLARITATDGMVFITFTAQSGPTEVVSRFFTDDSSEARKYRRLVQMGFGDALHLANDPEKFQQLVARYPAHEHAARIHGGIILGEGAVWENVSLEGLLVDPIPFNDIPAHFRKIWGIDFGIGHPFAAVLAVHDADADIIRFIHEIRVKDALPDNHVGMMKRTAPAVPVAWPHDGSNRQESSGTELFKFYKGTSNNPGLVMRPVHAQYADGTYKTEAGVMDMLTRMRDGRLQVSRSLVKWQEEFRMYHRKNGLIVKVNDDLMSASRQAVMDIRYARAIHPISANQRAHQRPRGAVLTDPWTNQPVPV